MVSNRSALVALSLLALTGCVQAAPSDGVIKKVDVYYVGFNNLYRSRQSEADVRKNAGPPAQIVDQARLRSIQEELGKLRCERSSQTGGLDARLVADLQFDGVMKTFVADKDHLIRDGMACNLSPSLRNALGVD